MKNRMTHVRDHLVAMMEELSDKDADEKVVERAKATALVADKFIASVKVEITARQMLAEQNLPPVLEAPADDRPPLRAIGNGSAK